MVGVLDQLGGDVSEIGIQCSGPARSGHQANTPVPSTRLWAFALLRESSRDAWMELLTRVSRSRICGIGAGLDEPAFAWVGVLGQGDRQ